MRVLVIDDSPPRDRTAVPGLRAAGLVVDVVRTSTAGLSCALSVAYAVVVVVDAKRPGGDPVRTCRRLRSADLRTPIVVLSEHAGEGEEVAALNAGADDFLRRSGPPDVLAARLRALGRRGPIRSPSAVLRCGSLVLDPANRSVRRRGVPVDLTPREFALLEVLLKAAGEPVSKPELLDRVWGPDGGARPNSVEVYVHYLRSKIDVPFGARSVRTVYGVGYRVVPAR